MMTRKRRMTIIVLASILILILACLAIIPVRIAIARSRYPQPQAILVLSGNPDRVTFAANFAQTRPGLDIWYTTGFESSMDWRTLHRSRDCHGTDSFGQSGPRHGFQFYLTGR